MPKKTVSLVLGSGGARGLAHIGIIKVLEQRGYEVRSISGSSMGALIGGIYAAGELDSYTKWVCALDRIDVLKLLDVSFSGKALFKGERIIDTLKELIGDREIENLPVSYTAVATDLENSKEVWLSQGPLFDAIRASIAFPTVFSAFEYGGRLLVDGGLLNPVPIAPTLRDMTDLTIAVSLSGKAAYREPELPQPEKSEPRTWYHQKVFDFVNGLQDMFNGNGHDDDTGFFDVISMSIDAMQSTIANFKLAGHSPDVLIELPKNICTIYEFERAVEMIEIGHKKAEQVLDAYEKKVGGS